MKSDENSDRFPLCAQDVRTFFFVLKEVVGVFHYLKYECVS